MSPRELLVELREKGVEVKANGDRLVIDAPKGAITPDLRDALAANKAALLEILAETPIEKPKPVSVPTPIEKPAFPTQPPVSQPGPRRVFPAASREMQLTSAEAASV